MKKNEELFTDEEKIDAFDRISKLFFNGNFGSTSKGDLELLMFSIYYDALIEKENEKLATDYSISKQLCLTQSKIANLKIKKQLRYPNEKLNWEKCFAEICANAVLKDDMIHLTIQERYVYLEIKNIVESNGDYVEECINKHLLKIDLPAFYTLLLSVAKTPEEKKQIESKFKELYKSKENESYSFEEFLKESGKEIFNMALNALLPSISGSLLKIINNAIRLFK